MNRVVSLENVIMDALKDLWKKIKQVLNKMVAFVRKWYLKLLDGASRLKRRAQAIKKSADGKSGSTDKKKLEDSPLLKQVHINKKAPSIADITATLSLVKEYSSLVLSSRTSSEYGDKLSGFVDIAETVKVEKGTAMRGIGTPATTITANSQSAFNTALTGLTSALATYAAKGGTPSKLTERYSNHNGNTLKGTTELIGGKCIVSGTRTYSFTVDSSVAKNTGDIRFELPETFVDDYSDKKIDVDKGNLEMLSPSVVSGYCDKVIEILDDIINYKAGWDKYETATKTFTKKMDKITDGKIDEEDKGKINIYRFTAKVGNAAVKSQASSCKAAISLGMSVSRAVLAYGNACLGAYKN